MNRRSLVVLVSIAAAALIAAAYLLVADAETETTASTPTLDTAEDRLTSTVPYAASAPASAAPEATTTTTTAATTRITLSPGSTACDAYETITTTGIVASPDIVEASGMAASRTRPGTLWAHNDSRDGARVYAIGPDGSNLGGFDIAGAFAFDWEDMAAGTSGEAATSSLYFGDIGDNFSIRGGRITVYRVSEPDPATLDGPIEGAAALEFEYPDGVYNAEALFVADDSLYVVTKDDDEARVYRGDATRDETGVETLEFVVSLDLDAQVSGADVSWDGATIALRGYRTVWLWHRSAGVSVAEAFTAEPCLAPSPEEVQGESIAFLADGAYATISEGRNPDLFVVPFGK